MAKRIVPFAVLTVVVGALAASVLRAPASAEGFDVDAFRRLPVSVNGRVQPFDSVAKVALKRIRGSETVPDEGDGPKPSRTGSLDPILWLLEVLARPDAADTRRIFPVDAAELMAKLSLRPAHRATTYWAFQDLGLKADEIGKQVRRIAGVKAADRAPWEREMVALHARLVVYERLKNSVQPNSSLQRTAQGRPTAFVFADALRTYRADLAEAGRVGERHRQDAAAALDGATEGRLRAFARLFQPVSRMGLLAAIPPRRLDDPRARWATTGSAIVASASGERLSAPVSYIAVMTSAFARGNASAFNAAVARYRQWLVSNGLAPAVNRARLEVLYNGLQPSVRAIVVYVAGLMLIGLAWRTGWATARHTGALMVVLGFVLQTTALAFAFQLAGRPSSLALSGWALAVAAMVVGWFRLRTSPTPKPRTERKGISLSRYFGAGRSLRTE